jgi:hypothetical protein
LAALEAATQRPRVCAANDVTTWGSNFKQLADARWLGGRVKPRHGA